MATLRQTAAIVFVKSIMQTFVISAWTIVYKYQFWGQLFETRLA